MDIERAFSDIYARQAWGEGPSLSGPGSDPAIVGPYVSYIDQLIHECGIESVLDLGHGDWAMWPDDAFSTVSYVGIEIVPHVSRRVQETFSRPGRDFLLANVASIDLPSADLVICKDVLMHLPDQQVSEVLEKIATFPRTVICHDVLPKSPSVAAWLHQMRAQFAPRYRWSELRAKKRFWRRLMKTNQEILAGDYRPLDLQRSPWKLSEFGLRTIKVFDIPSNNPWPGVVKRVWSLVRA